MEAITYALDNDIGYCMKAWSRESPITLMTVTKGIPAAERRSSNFGNSTHNLKLRMNPETLIAASPTSGPYVKIFGQFEWQEESETFSIPF
jgi:hypothetical protein